MQRLGFNRLIGLSIQSANFSTSSFRRAKIDVHGLKINCQKFGKGPQTVLFCPGFAGSIQELVMPFVRKMNLNEFTIVGWDPPGYGKSQSADRSILAKDEFPPITDARIAAKMMQLLGYDKYSIIGHSNGGVTGAVIAGLFPDVVMRLIMCNSPFRMNARTVQAVEMMRELEMWTPAQRASIRRVYELDYFYKLCDDWRNIVYKESKELKIQPILRKIYEQIVCPTLYIQGMKDLVVPTDEGRAYAALLKRCELVPIAEGTHDPLVCLPELVALFEQFLRKSEMEQEAVNVQN